MYIYVTNRPKRENVGLGTGTVCTGSSNLLSDPARIFASMFFSHVRPRNTPYYGTETYRCVSDGERRKERQYTAAIQYTD